MGYLNANFRTTARPVGKDAHRLDVTYTISEGPKVILGSVITLGAKVTRPSLVDKTVRLKTEEPLQEDELLSAEGRLYNLEIFDWAEIDPRRQITTQSEEDVLVKLHESRQNDIKYGFGFEVMNRGAAYSSGTIALPGLPPVGLPSNFKTSETTFWGPRATFQYTRNNFRGLGETLTFAALGARLRCGEVPPLTRILILLEPTGARTSRSRQNVTVRIRFSPPAPVILVSSWNGSWMKRRPEHLRCATTTGRLRSPTC